MIKVGDFGLSEDVYRTGYFRLDKGSSGVRLPFKWLAPESIQDGVFNEKTDVVSLACLGHRRPSNCGHKLHHTVAVPNTFASYILIVQSSFPFSHMVLAVVIWCDVLGGIHLWQTSLCWCGPN